MVVLSLERAPMEIVVFGRGVSDTKMDGLQQPPLQTSLNPSEGPSYFLKSVRPGRSLVAKSKEIFEPHTSGKGEVFSCVIMTG